MSVQMSAFFFLYKFLSALEFSTIVSSPSGHAPSNSTYALLKKGYTATYWWFYTRWFLIYFPLVFRPHVIPLCHLVAAPLASTSRCKGELLRLLHLCAITFSFPSHTHSASLAAGRHTWLHFISPSSIPVFIYLFIFPPPPFISHLLRRSSREALGMLLYHWLRPIALGKERRSDLQLDTCTQFSQPSSAAALLSVTFWRDLLVLKDSAFQKKYRWPC